MKIEKGVPVPETDKPYTGYGGRPAKYPWREMEVGDSILFENQSNMSSAHGSALSAAKTALHHGIFVRFTTRQEGNDLRIWKAEEYRIAGHGK